MAVIHEDKIALLKQSYVSDHWVLVAGYIKRGDCGEETAKREVEEETGLQVKDLQYLASYYYEKRDMLMLGYVVDVELDDFKISDEVDAIKWFKLDEAHQYVREGSIAYEHLVKCRESRK